jgi:hypothetical protein
MCCSNLVSVDSAPLVLYLLCLFYVLVFKFQNHFGTRVGFNVNTIDFLVFLIKRLDFSCDLFSGYNGCFNIDWIFVCDLRIQLMI